MAKVQLPAYLALLPLRGMLVSNQSRSYVGVLVTTIALVLAFSPRSAETSDKTAGLTFSLLSNTCPQGLHHQPNGPFAVMVFCEDALGRYVAVICYDPGRCEKSELPDRTIRFAGWSFEKRVWQEEPWTSDVSGLAWSPDGKRLYISSGEIYGAGGLYELNLEQHKFRQLLPLGWTTSSSKPGPGYVITAIDPDGRRLQYQTGEPGTKHTLVLDEPGR